MKFRQRMAWLFVLLYLGGTFACFYYIFEINDHYNSFAVDHVQKFHSQNAQKTKTEGIDSPKDSAFTSLWHHVTDIPLPVWMLLFLLPYMQIFMMLLACTKQEPKLSIAYKWPALVYFKYQQLVKREKSSNFDVIVPNTYSLQYSNGSTVQHA